MCANVIIICQTSKFMYVKYGLETGIRVLHICKYWFENVNDDNSCLQTD